MTSHISLPLLDIWQRQIDDSTIYCQELFKIHTQNINALTQWQLFMGQSYTEWLNLCHQWQDLLEQWLTNWSDISGYTLQSTPPFGMLLPPLKDLSRLNQAFIQLMEQSTDIMLKGLGALTPDWAVALTTHVTHLETTMTHINQSLEIITVRLDTSDIFVTEQVQALREQVQTTHDATTQQLTALIQRLDEAQPCPARSSTRPPTRREP